MAGASCIYAPEVGGKRSELYMDLLTTFKLGRPLTNYIYAQYLTSNLPTVLDAAGKKRNSQGEHNAKDILDQINYAAIQSEVAGLSGAERTLGAVDATGKRVDFTDAKLALEKAEGFNNTHKGLVARVQQVGTSNLWNIIVEQKTAKNNTMGTGVTNRLNVWRALETEFATKGVDINNVPPEIYSSFNPFNIALINNLALIKNTSFNNLRKDAALILFNIGMQRTDPHAQRLIANFGSLEAAAQLLNDINVGIVTTATPAQEHLLRAAVNHCQQFQGIDIVALENQVQQVSQNTILADAETDIHKKVRDLHRLYKIDTDEIDKVNSDIDSLSEAAAEAVMLIQRQIREIEGKMGRTQRVKDLEIALNQLLKELANKKYYAGMINFLQDASNQIAGIQTLWTNYLALPQGNTSLEGAFNRAKAIEDVKDILFQYYPLITALANKALLIDERINPTDIQRIRQTATTLKDELDKYNNLIRGESEQVMTDILLQIVGNTMPDGQAVINAIKMGAADSTIYDFLYSMGRVSNPMIAAMGTIVRNAQEGRTLKMVALSKRIDRATYKLHKSGSNSKFIYEDDGHIISDIDWAAYEAAKEAATQNLVRQGFRKGELRQAIKDWEEQNTEERVVDTTNMRTERVPDARYRNNKATWDDVNHKMVFNPGVLTQAQQTYYDEMMQIKGEIGSMLPEYAQDHYLPPQLRRNMLDALGEAKSSKDVYNAIKNKVQNLYKIREDDTEYNVVTDAGEEAHLALSDYDNTPLRRIPIFFINKVEQGELLKDFSSGISALAGTAINYEAMANIQKVIEFMRDYVEDRIAPLPNETKVDKAENERIRVIKHLINYTRNTDTEKLLEGFISQHFYGQRIDPNTPGYKYRKLITKLIGYTSFKGLATNIKGAFSNYLVGEFQMLIEAGAGEFYGFKDYLWAHTKLFGKAGVGGEISELLTNNVNHKATLFRDLFDPISETFSDKMHKRYHTSMFRQLVGHDCSFIGYTSGEYLIHYVNMYSVLHKEKVLLNGKEICLYDAYEVTNKQDGNSEIKLKQGVTDLKGKPITGDYKLEFEKKIKSRIKYANDSTHGAMNAEDKGYIHQKLWGRATMNFRQWMVEHYSRRFRKTHFDWTLGENREGYWYTLYKQLWNEDTKEAWKTNKMDAMSMFIKDYCTFMFRAQSQWSNLNDMQKANIKRVRTETALWLALCGLSFALGAPDDHKEEFWRRWWIYQVKRLKLDTEASMPNVRMLSSGLTILQSPMAGVSVANSLLYCIYGLSNGDLFKEIQSGPHKGENKYLRTVKKNTLPFFKDWEQMQNMATEDAIFKIFDDSPAQH
jgi:hypothetical protein